MDKRQRFEGLLHEKSEVVVLFTHTKEVIQRDYLADLRTLYKGLHPHACKISLRGERWLIDRLPSDDVANLLASHQPHVNTWYERRDTKLKILDVQLNELAQDLTPLPGDKRLKLHWVYGGAYRSQGLGAETYARKSAERQLLNVPEGIKTEIVDADGSFTIYVYVKGQADVEIIKRKPASTLRDQVKWCLKNGVNPRVYWPFLPHGYEEEVGLDHFGNEVKHG